MLKTELYIFSLKQLEQAISMVIMYGCQLFVDYETAQKIDKMVGLDKLNGLIIITEPFIGEFQDV